VNEYAIASVVAVVAVVAVELFWLRTGIFTSLTYWISYAIILFFQVLVDGWLTKLSAPIVLYNSDHITDVRVPFDIPVEDYLFGFALVTLPITLWERAGRRRAGAAVGASATGGTRPSRPR
jgi:lycopene cyclase domain-containing protein